MKETATSILIALLLIGGAFWLTRDREVEQNLGETIAPGANVKVVDGRQIIEIRAKAGYQPRRSVAKAGIPTTLRFDSKGTFDCSASVSIPEKKIRQSLDFSGSTDIDIGTPIAGVMKGGCSMGMYPFEIDFQS